MGVNWSLLQRVWFLFSERDTLGAGVIVTGQSAVAVPQLALTVAMEMMPDVSGIPVISPVSGL